MNWYKKNNKYRNKINLCDGVRFASIREKNRYIDLKALLAFGNISELRLQPKFVLAVNGMRICMYIADFSYIEKGKKIIEDVKGFSTPVYLLKKKLMKAIYEIEIRET